MSVGGHLRQLLGAGAFCQLHVGDVRHHSFLNKCRTVLCRYGGSWSGYQVNAHNGRDLDCCNAARPAGIIFYPLSLSRPGFWPWLLAQLAPPLPLPPSQQLPLLLSQQLPLPPSQQPPLRPSQPLPLLPWPLPPPLL